MAWLVEKGADGACLPSTRQVIFPLACQRFTTAKISKRRHSPLRAILRKHQNAGVLVGFEGRQQITIGTEKLNNGICRTVSNSAEDELGRMAEDKAPLMEVRIFRNDRVATLLGKRPK